MNSFQSIATITFAVLIIATSVAFVRRTIQLRSAVAWTLVWLLGMALVLQPSLTSQVARELGIGRGADLVFYCSIGVMLIGFFLFYIRYRAVESEITKIVRQMAIRDAERKLDASEKEGQER